MKLIEYRWITEVIVKNVLFCPFMLIKATLPFSMKAFLDVRLFPFLVPDTVWANYLFVLLSKARNKLIDFQLISMHLVCRKKHQIQLSKKIEEKQTAIDSGS